MGSYVPNLGCGCEPRRCWRFRINFDHTEYLIVAPKYTSTPVFLHFAYGKAASVDGYRTRVLLISAKSPLPALSKKELVVFQYVPSGLLSCKATDREALRKTACYHIKPYMTVCAWLLYAVYCTHRSHARRGNCIQTYIKRAMGGTSPSKRKTEEALNLSTI